MPKLKVVSDEGGEAPSEPSNWQSEDLYDWLVKPSPTGRYLVKDLLPAEGLILMSGQQKLTYKTFTAFTMMLALATGKSMSLIQPQDEGTVLGIEEEGASHETKARLWALCNAMKIDPKTLKNKVGWVYRQGVDLIDKTWNERLLGEVERLKPKLIFFDAMFALHSGNENSTEDMQPIVRLFNRLRAVCGSSILYLAHLNEQHGWNPRADMDRQVRGSGVFPQAADLHFALRRYDEHDSTIKLLLRPRGAEPKRFGVSWTFDTEVDEAGSSLLKAAHLSMAEAKDEPQVKQTDFKPQPGQYYEQSQLRKILNMRLADVRKWAMQQVQDGVLVIVPGEKSAWRCVK